MPQRHLSITMAARGGWENNMSSSVQFGMVGLGKMGKPIAEKLIASGHTIVVANRSPEPLAALKARGAIVAEGIEDLKGYLHAPRVVWSMLPAGEATEELVNQLADFLEKGDVVIDGGNSNYEDTMRRAAMLKVKGIHLLDCGTSGGVHGGEIGFSLMIGGVQQGFVIAEKYFKSLSEPTGAYAHFGPAGAGHFVKMIHNGIEYGIMQAIGEGMAILHAKEEFNFDLAEAARVWRHGSVIRSWLMDLTEQALRDKEFAEIQDYVSDSGEGRWTVREAERLSVPAPVLTLALIERFASRVDENFAHKINAALRKQFGGHPVKK